MKVSWINQLIRWCDSLSDNLNERDSQIEMNVIIMRKKSIRSDHRKKSHWASCTNDEMHFNQQSINIEMQIKLDQHQLSPSVSTWKHARTVTALSREPYTQTFVFASLSAINLIKKNSNTNLTIERKKKFYAQKKSCLWECNFSWYRNAQTSKSLSSLNVCGEA
jgi:hypothetical protein